MFKINNVKCIYCTKNADGSIRALKVTGDFFGAEPAWVPNYAIHDDSEVWKQGTEGTLIVYYDFAERRGWLK